ncbi:MAG: hypothetical protein GW903_03920 [Alphaproteobacteria bacterium]|nr:hypothetical protein [Alphaproteobacteria bacterium]NCQ88118.1 hypothetical protein [Alphaproteobacteria bacterium]NCT05375.1 hypothetical protein [Alphaproteobacteria bacterium]
MAEPLNALSNIAFIIAAIAALILAKKKNALNAYVIKLIVLIAAIGIGSSLFHTYANVWSKFADVLPILLFKISFLISYSHLVIGLKRSKIFALFILFLGLSVLSGMMPYSWLNGSLGYSPALIFLIGFGAYHLRAQKHEPWILLLAALLFVISLSFRSIDMLICEALPIGVHYMWHILNGIVLYLCVRSIIKNIK